MGLVESLSDFIMFKIKLEILHTKIVQNGNIPICLDFYISNCKAGIFKLSVNIKPCVNIPVTIEYNLESEATLL